MSRSRLNVGLIGAGRIGRLHAEHLARRLPAARLVAIADLNEAAAQACASNVGDVTPVRVCGDYRALLELPEVEAVVICSATDTHAQIIEEAAQVGKHIFCEKPIDLELARIDLALGAVAGAGVKLQIGFNRRFDASFARVRQAIQDGAIGTVWRLHLTSRDPEPPPLGYIASSGGLFLDMAIHDFDMACFLVGSPVVEVSAVAGVLVDPAIGAAGDVDTAVTVLQFANGAIGSIDNSRAAAYGYDQRVEVLGSRGMVSTANQYPNAATISDAGSVRRDVPLHFFMQRYTESYLQEMAAFVDAVLHDTPVPVDGRAGRQAVVLGVAAERSYREHRPVRVDEIFPVSAACGSDDGDGVDHRAGGAFDFDGQGDEQELVDPLGGQGL
jgi:myo-inositol 2-dehydrogenase/D-chiro-inositol 1-dehydrogenase